VLSFDLGDGIFIVLGVKPSGIVKMANCIETVEAIVL